MTSSISAPHAAGPPLVRLERVSKSYTTPAGTRVAVDDVSLEVREGEILGVIGYSGAGKSTLVRLINALELPTSGKVFVGDDELTALPESRLRQVRQGIGMIFQQFNLFRSRTVAGNVAFPLRVAGLGRAERDARTAEILDFVGLLDRAYSYPEQLSGGQKQRVGIARALATNPRILLADEATSALDPETTADVLALLRRINRDLGVTVVVITHEMDAIRAIADRVVVMDEGRVVEQGDVYDVFSAPSTAAAAKFVRSVLQDRPSAETLARLRQNHPGRIATIQVAEIKNFIGVVTTIFLEAGVDAELVFGGISELQERAIGALTYELSGPDERIDAALAALTEHSLTWNEES